MTVWGSSSRTGSRQTKASAARIAPILIPKGWKNAAAYPMRCGTKPRSTLLRQASAGGDFGPRGASAATVSRTTAFLDSIRLCGRKADRFPHLAASRAGRQRPPSAPPHRIVRRRQRLSNLPDLPAKSRRIAIIDSRTTLCSAAPDRAAEATYQYSSVTDRGNRMGRAAASPNLKLLLEKETRRCRRPKLSAQTIRASKDGIVPSARSRFTCASTSS